MKLMNSPWLMLVGAVLNCISSCALPRQELVLNEQTRREVIDSALSA